MKKYFSNKESSFYVQETVEFYAEGEIPIPDDLFEITDDEYRTFAVSPDRKIPHFNTDKKCMEWIDLPAPTQQELITNAGFMKASKMSQADETIKPLQDAVDTGMSTDEESKRLLAWKRYRVLLNRVETSSAPNIEWPECPT
ncbi:tail fiber assembly protein [Enterobacter asburiae]|uniref:tail fiber assembly protein n=1 Tax=Enterobacter asburiae TaxID=61645 RepID=UPI002A54C606|nr:tail fiber assembly protein [Enterobacter hormaechei]